jgi:hypothetical protein
VSATSVLVEIYPAGVVAGLSLFAAQQRLNRSRQSKPRVPADVDLQQAVATTKAIADAGPQQYRTGRARGYAGRPS